MKNYTNKTYLFLNKMSPKILRAFMRYHEILSNQIRTNLQYIWSHLTQTQLLCNLKSALQYTDSVHNYTYFLSSISLSFSFFFSSFLLSILFHYCIIKFHHGVHETCSIVENRIPWNFFVICQEIQTDFLMHENITKELNI